MNINKEIISALEHRYATKRMTGAKLNKEDIETILEVIRLAPTSYGLQPFRVIVSDNKEFLDQVFEKSCPQIVIQQCSHLLVLKAPKKLTMEQVESYLEKLKTIRNEDSEYLANNREKLKKVVENPVINRAEWLKMQTYIILGYVTFAAAIMGIDATPIEGFNPAAMDEILNLDTNKEGSTLLIALGYRDSEADTIAHKPKIRKPLHDIVKWI